MYKRQPIISFVPNTEMTISKYLKKIRALFDDISARKLEKRVELPEKIAKYTLACLLYTSHERL